jgi:penicillin-binding protein 1B
VKEWITKFNETMDSLAASKWLHYLRITGGVVWNLALIFIVVFVVLGVFAVSVGAGYFASLVDDEPLRPEKEMRNMIFSYEETSEVYFANNVYIGKLRTDLERRETSLAKVSQHVINAVLATEDEYFREHNGIVPKAVIRGLLQDVSNSSTQTGGSTLTQQLIKNQILTNEVSYERKAKEILLALRLEKFMKKEEILEAYLNIIPYGRNANGRNIAGIETAAEGIFGVKAADLNLAQSAYIAGLPQAPFKYTPFTNKGERKTPEQMQAGIDRMKTVLFRMKEVGYINEADYEAAIVYDIAKDFREPEQRAEDKYPWLTAEVERRAVQILMILIAEQDGIDPARLKEEDNLYEKYKIIAERSVRSNGYRIYTTLNKEMYDAMNTAAAAYENYGHTYTETYTDENGDEATRPLPVQVGSVAMETKTGKILAFVAGRDHSIEQLNHATQARRSNGSTMKPLIVYGPAIEYGIIGAGSPVVDVKIENGWSPNNFNVDEERGLVSARDALEDSLNIPAARLYNEILDRRPAEYLLQLGVEKLHPEDFENLSTSLGALWHGITVEENTNAYQAIANNGQFIDGYMIEKIVDLDGNVIYEHKAEPVQVYTPETAYILTDMLRGVLSEGTGVSAKNSLKFNADFAAKTGTTSFYGDVWFMGYNPNITLGVWLGYKDLNLGLGTFNNQYGHPSTRINRLWASLMNSLYDVNPEFIGTNEQYVQPSNVVSAPFCGISGMAPSEACSNTGLVRTDLFNKAVFLPTLPDDSLTSGTSVFVNGSSYPALSSTPSEFVSTGGVGLSQAFVDRVLGKLGGDASKLLRGIGTIADSDNEGGGLVEDTVPPSAVTANVIGNSIVWSRSSSNDVVGYRIYTVTDGGRLLVGSVSSAETYSFPISRGIEYFVIAVDITGLESPASNIVGNTNVEPSSTPGPGGNYGNRPPNGRPGSGDDRDTDDDDDDDGASDDDNDSNDDESSSRD